MEYKSADLMLLSILVVDGENLPKDKQKEYSEAAYGLFISGYRQDYNNVALQALYACWKESGGNIEIATVPQQNVNRVLRGAEESSILYSSFIETSDYGERHIRAICLGPAFMKQLNRLHHEGRILSLTLKQ